MIDDEEETRSREYLIVYYGPTLWRSTVLNSLLPALVLAHILLRPPRQKGTRATRCATEKYARKKIAARDFMFRGENGNAKRVRWYADTLPTTTQRHTSTALVVAHCYFSSPFMQRRRTQS